MTEEPYIFTCVHCGWTGESAWSREDAAAECKALWGPLDPGGDRVTLCDPCFEEFMAWLGRQNQA